MRARELGRAEASMCRRKGYRRRAQQRARRLTPGNVTQRGAVRRTRCLGKMGVPRAAAHALAMAPGWQGERETPGAAPRGRAPFA
jgi:hypothetical protein